jgi:hypothetical protein
MLLRLLRAVHHWRRRDYVTAAHLAALNRYEDTRGIDWSSWRTPKELHRMRIAEARKLILFAKTKRSA